MSDDAESASPVTRGSIASRVNEMVTSIESGGGEGAEAATDSDAGTVPPAGTDSVAASALAPEQVEANKAAEARLAAIEAKLAEARDRRAAAKHGKIARAEREAAEADRRAAAQERARYDALKQGTFKETIAALGRDPREVFQEMQREAVEANTPEAEMKRMRADFERQIGETVEPLRKTIAELQAERNAIASQAYDGQLVSAFQADIQDADYTGLRTEYDDADLLEYVRHFDRNPKVMLAEARRFGVRLTNSDGRFTMREALTVLKSAQDAHDQGRQQRAARLAPAAPPAKSPTVNGTAPRGNAATTIGNDVASERASPGRRLTRRERIEAEIERQEKR